MPAIEIEMRARFDSATYERLVSFLATYAEDLGVDDKRIYFYVLPDTLLKVTDNIAAGTAKISVKANRIGQGAAFPEIELPIAREEVGRAVELFGALGFAHAMHEAFNKRHNFQYQGVEIAVKWSEAWGHHAELEVLLDDAPSEAGQLEAAQRIEAVADRLGVQLMSEDELAEFTATFEAALAAGGGSAGS